jgi:hypothetical protein
VNTLVGFIEAFLTLSVAITLGRLSTDTGGGDYFFTLVALVLAGAAAPYFVALAAIRRLPPQAAKSTAIATVAFGVCDALVRTQAFFFPTERSGGGMALWLPVYGLCVIPLVTVIVHTFAMVVQRAKA